MKPLSEQLYELLPAVHRLRDADNDNALQRLLQAIAEQVGLVEENIVQLYDDWFIETCEEWLVPYIGDLLGVRGLNQIQESGFTQRARIANSLAYRRRKGTATMLEQLARDTTLWPARVVEFFQLLATTQYINHLRPANLRTPDLRQVDLLDQLDGPFDRIAHTADVRRISNEKVSAIGRGRYNIPNVGIFLWRLQSYTLRDAAPQPAGGTNDGRFTFSPLGATLPLFHKPQTEETITHLAEPADVPDPIRPLAFLRDLQGYARRSLILPPASRTDGATYYGPAASLEITRGGLPVSPLEIACMDLSTWSRPPARVGGLLSGELPDPLVLTAGLGVDTPSIDVTFGAEGPHSAVLTALPAIPAEAAAILGEAIRAAHPSPAFSQAQVVLAGKRLLVLPGQPGLAVTLGPTAADATTLNELLLDAPVPVEAALSSPLRPFPALFPARLQVTIAGLGPRDLDLAPIPVTLPDATHRLQDKLQGAGGEPDFTEAQVLILDDRLLVVPGVTSGGASAGPVVFATHPTDTSTLFRLGLNEQIGVDVALGRLVFPLGDPAADIRVTYTYGFSGDLGGGPYDRRYLRKPGEPVPSPYQNTVADPQGLDAIIRVPDDFPTLTLALDHWENVLHKPDAVIEITDNLTYVEDFATDVGPANLVIQSANQRRAAILGNITISGSEHGRLALNGLLIAGQIAIPDGASLRQLDLLHTTLVPGRRLDQAGEPLEPHTPSLLVGAADPDLQINLLRSISGPLQLPEGIAGLRITDCLLESPRRGQPASISPVLVSGPLSTVSLSAAAPQLMITIGEEGPYALRLDPKPTTLAQARARLEDAIHALSDDGDKGPAFNDAYVLSAGNRLIVLPGMPAPVTFTAFCSPASTDLTVTELRLDVAQAEARFALLSGPVDAFPLSAASPEVTLTLGSESAVAQITPPATLAQARDNLQAAVRAASASQPFAAALVASLPSSGQLVVVPGSGQDAPRYSASPNDATTLEQLTLESDHFLIAASPAGEQPASPATFIRTTLLGAVHVKEITLGSECIFAGLLLAERRQAGCVRFSYVPPGARTPLRYRCQPDLEIAAETDDQKPATPADAQDLAERIQGWLAPSFTSTRYGSPAYGQLSWACPVQIRTGAEDGSEMGAFSFLKQPQRESNLRLSLDEYLRLGLDAGIFFVT
jgi:hypothetical protein